MHTDSSFIQPAVATTIAADKLGVRSQPFVSAPGNRRLGLAHSFALWRMTLVAQAYSLSLRAQSSTPIKYEFLSVDPDVIRFAWDNRKDYVVVGLGYSLRVPATAQVIVAWLRDHMDAARGGFVPPIVTRLAIDPCEGGVDGNRSPKCGQCLRCGFVLTPVDAFCLEIWLDQFTEVKPEVVYESTGPGQDFVALWGLITITWTWEALVSLLQLPELDGLPGVSDAAWLWSVMLKYLVVKSPRAALQALHDRAHPPDVTITKRDVLPLLQHEDREVRNIAVGLLGEMFGPDVPDSVPDSEVA